MHNHKVRISVEGVFDRYMQDRIFTKSSRLLKTLFFDSLAQYRDVLAKSRTVKSLVFAFRELKKAGSLLRSRAREWRHKSI